MCARILIFLYFDLGMINLFVKLLNLWGEAGPLQFINANTVMIRYIINLIAEANDYILQMKKDVVC